MALFDFNRDILSITKAPTRHFFRYISLYNGYEHIKGLTIYNSVSGIVGLEAYFNRGLQLSGYRTGCALHFPLHAKERIAYAWLRIINSNSPAFAEPALIVGFFQFLSRSLLTQVTRSRRHLEECIPLGHIFYRPWWLVITTNGFFFVQMKDAFRGCFTKT